MNNIIEYDQLVSFLKQASAFEIYRMMVALQNELDNPTRLAQISTKIKRLCWILSSKFRQRHYWTGRTPKL